MALEGVAQCFERAGDVRHLRMHGDCRPSNVLWTDAGPHFVDFDDSRMGPAIQDLWLLLPAGRADASRALADLLAGYEDFAEFDPRELHLIEALRILRLIHYSAWLARRWNDPAFPVTFPWFNTQCYWEDRILELREQIGAMQEGRSGRSEIFRHIYTLSAFRTTLKCHFAHAMITILILSPPFDRYA